MIRLENIDKSFEGESGTVVAANNVNLHIEKGKIFGIIGFSGAGKSTLVRCINLLERPTKGKVYIDGTEITSLSKKELRAKRKKIGMIFQHFNLFASRNVYQNIAYPLKYRGKSKSEINKKVNELLELVGLTDKIHAYPSQLSGGQKQRVAIARALANDPEILLSDEATSALDPQTTKSILKLLKELNAKLGITIVLITHEMQVVKEICDQVVVMENGEVIEQGDLFNIFAAPREGITREFVESTSNLSKIYELIEEKRAVVQTKAGEFIIRLRYLKRNASESLISYISRNYNLDANIIFGNIELIGDNPIGGLVAIVSGKEEDIYAAIRFLKDKGVGVEVINNGVLA
ncbi:MAG TPA: methionine ABC transporter ATP-binding protein [Clostridiales bacterium]|nr:methionine ABC transporter ATP-binding protein [Clostridiales bacterium]